MNEAFDPEQAILNYFKEKPYIISFGQPEETFRTVQVRRPGSAKKMEITYHVSEFYSDMFNHDRVLKHLEGVILEEFKPSA